MIDLVKHRVIIFIVSIALFMESLDANILNTAIPSMSKTLAVNPIDLKIALIGYLLGLSIFIPVSGWLADKYGAKKIFLAAVAIFCLSSVWCALTTCLPELVIARIFQGLGGALMMPIARLVLLRAVGKSNLVFAMNRVIMISSLGIMLGPVLGGLLTEYLTWRWIFWINLPVGFLLFGLAYKLLTPQNKIPTPPLDKVGFLLFGLGLAGLTFSLSAFSETAISGAKALGILLVSSLLLFGYFWHSKTIPHPIVKSSLFKSRVFRIAALGNVIARLSFAGTPFLLPLLLQIGLGYSPPVSGTLLIPMAAGVMLAKKPVSYLLKLLGYKHLLLMNMVVLSLLLLFCALLTKHTPIGFIAGLIFVFGVIVSIQYGCMNSLAYSSVNKEDYSAATSFISTLQQLGNSFGVACSALLVRCFSPSATHFSLSPTVFHHAFVVMGIMTLITAIFFTRLSAKDGYELFASDDQTRNQPTLAK